MAPVAPSIRLPSRLHLYVNSASARGLLAETSNVMVPSNKPSALSVNESITGVFDSS